MVRSGFVDRVCIFLGVILIVYGVAMIYVPAALIVSGGGLLAGSLRRKA